MFLLQDINVLDNTKHLMKDFLLTYQKLKETEPEVFHDDIKKELLNICRMSFLESVITLYPEYDIEKALIVSEDIDDKYLRLMYD